MKNPIHLRVVQPDGTVIVRTIPKLPVRLGRGAENEIVLKDRNVSRVHVELRLSGDQVFVHDCESLNGTRLNGELIVDAALHVGDVLMIGDCQVKMLDEPTWSTEKDGTDSIRVRPDGTGGVLEVIRAIDLERILRKDPQNEFTSPFSQLADGEDLRDRVNKLNQAWANLLVIMNVVSSMGNFSHPQQVCEQFVAALKGVFPMVENVAVIQFDPEASALGVVYQMGFTAPFITFTHPSKTVLRRVVDEMRAVYAVDARKDPRFSGADSLQSRGVRSMMCAPLIVRGEVRGALYVENLTTPYCFSQFDLNFLTVFAFHLGAALETSRALAERDKAFDRAVESIKAVKQDKTALLLQYSQSERKFRALFEQSALGSAVINLLTGRIEEVNDGLVRMLGFSRRALAGMNYEQLLSDADRSGSMEWLRHVRQNGEGSATTHLKTSGGDIIVALQSCRALRVGDSAVMAAYFIDITAKERAEEETKTQLLRVTALSELSQALMRTMDPAAIHRLLFEKVRTVLPIDDFQIAMARPDSDELEVVFAATREPDDSFAVSTESERIPRGHPLVRAALSGGRPEVFLQTRGDNGLQDQKRHPGLTVLPSALAIPFSSREHVGGVVCAQSATYGAYDSSHVETLGALVAQAALALSNAQGFASLREQQEDLRRLSVQIMTAQETERGRISRELHDGVGQQLTAMKYVLEAIRGASKSGDEAKLAGRISEARELAAQIIADLRSISLDLRPTMLDDLGLKPTVEWLTRQNSERYGIEVNLDYTVGEDTPLPPEIATSAFRIVQEALGNVAKHSKATRVDIAIGMTGASLCLAVSDNGVGFDTVSLPRMQAARGCSGMLNMKERARFLGGDFSLESAPSKGTKLSVSIPVKEVV